MSLKSLIKQVLNSDSSDTVFSVMPDVEGLNLFVEYSLLQDCENGIADLLILNQYACLQMLVEQGVVESIRNGFVIPSEYAVSLDADVRYLLKLPSLFEGSVSAKVEGLSTQSAFKVSLILHYQAEDIYSYELIGPCLKISEKEVFLLNSQQWLAFSSARHHQNLSASDKNEQQNLLLINHLQQAKQAGLNIDLAQFNKLNIIHPDKVGVAAEEDINGDLVLTPTFGASINPHDTSKRLGQLKDSNNIASMHIRDDIVLLDEARFKATQEILTNRRIPKDQIKHFLSTPSAFLDAALVDLDTGFSLRVKGATAFHHGYFGDTDDSGIEWFGELAEKTLNTSLVDNLLDINDVKEFEEIFNDAIEHGAETVFFNDNNIDISKPDEVKQQIEKLKEKFSKIIEDEEIGIGSEKEPILEKAVVDIVTNDDDLEYGDASLREQAKQSSFTETIDFNDYRRQPFPHQEEGVRWLLGLMQSALKQKELKSSDSKVRGALLADDMGLGKTYMSLVSIAEVYKLPELQGETKECGFNNLQN